MNKKGASKDCIVGDEIAQTVRILLWADSQNTKLLANTQRFPLKLLDYSIEPPLRAWVAATVGDTYCPIGL